MAPKKKRSENDSPATHRIPGLNLDQLVDHLPCYVSIQDRDLNLLYVNAKFKRDFGDGVGKKCHLVYKCSPEICPNCPVQKTFEDRRPHLTEENVTLTGGGISQVLIQTAPIIDKNGVVTAVIELATNITQLKKDRKELVTLGQSIALLSHGIKNILEGLQGGAYVVDEGFRDNDIEMARKGWNIVNKNIFEITDVVQNILYSSKDRALKYERVSPGQLAKDSLALFSDKAAILDVELKPQINDTIPAARLDIASIRRMLNNLIWNALEACFNDRQKKTHAVTVKTEKLDNDHFMFEISDNGIGMDDDTLRNIYEEFFSTKGSSGTGLGLAVVEKVVNRHGGKIEVTSAPGEGTRFTIIFKIK
ncbi:MAG: GHKL domain-containing protein [Deltaproteobacteria bacterium]|nr:GHKL domain-containing protein [Deltaproteobacteria bacterium]